MVVFGYLSNTSAISRSESRDAERSADGVEVEEHVVLDRDFQLVVRGAGDVDAVDLTELALLLVHHGADDRAGRAAGERADDRAALRAVMSAVIADDRADDRAGSAADDRAFFGLRVLVVVVCANSGTASSRTEYRCSESFHDLSSLCRVHYYRNPGAMPRRSSLPVSGARCILRALMASESPMSASFATCCSMATYRSAILSKWRSTTPNSATTRRPRVRSGRGATTSLHPSCRPRFRSLWASSSANS